MAKIKIVEVGKTNEKYLKTGISIFTERLKHYCKLEIVTLSESKKREVHEKIEEESSRIHSIIQPSAYVIILDENGEQLSSRELAKLFEKHDLHNPNPLIFVIGGAFGHHDSLIKRANKVLSLSKMTFSHQMIRLFLLEQIYRAQTIIRNEKYHND